MLDSVLGTLKPLVSHSPGNAGSGVGLLSPASERSVGLLLELTLEIGITVRLLEDYCRLLAITKLLGLLEITGDYWGLLEITRDY